MATGTLGTTANNSLTSLIFKTSADQQNAQDFGAIMIIIKDDLNVAHPVYPGAYSQNGLLYVPNRGVLRVLPGDYVGVDSQGWPILVSANSIANDGWVHT